MEFSVDKYAVMYVNKGVIVESEEVETLGKINLQIYMNMFAG